MNAYTTHTVCGKNTTIPPERCHFCREVVAERYRAAAPELVEALRAMVAAADHSEWKPSARRKAVMGGWAPVDMLRRAATSARALLARLDGAA